MTRGTTRHALRSLRPGLRELLALRWLRVTLLVVLALFVLRLSLGWMLWAAADRLVADRGLALHWSDLDLSLASGRGSVEHLELGARDTAGAPLVAVEYGVFDLELLPLLTGDLEIRRAELDGVDVALERDASGAWSFERYLTPEELAALEGRAAPDEAAAPAPAEASAESELAEPAPIDLGAPLVVDALRCQHARVRLVDRTLEPPLELDVETSAMLSNLGDPERPVRFSVTCAGGDLFDGARLSGEARGTADELFVKLRAQAGSLRPRALAPLLESFDVAPACDALSCSLDAELALSVIGEARDTLRASATIADVRVSADGAEALALDRLTVELDALSRERATLPGIVISGVRGRVEREPGGVLRIGGFALLPVEGAAPPPDWLRPLSSALDVLAPRRLPRWARLFAAQDDAAYPWTLERLLIEGGELRVVDRAVEPPAEVPLLIERIELGPVVHDPALGPRPIPLVARLAAPGVAESIRLDGSLGPFAPERSVDLALEIDGIVLDALTAHLAGAGVAGALERGTFRMRLFGAARTDERGRTEGALELSEMALRDAGELAGVQRVVASGLVLDPTERLLRFGDVTIEGPRLALARDPSANVVGLGLRTLGFAPQSAAPAPADAAPAGRASADEPAAAPAALPALEPVRVELGRFAWSNSDLELVDELADPPQRFEVRELGFEVEELVLDGDPEAPPSEPARIRGRLVVDGVVGELTAEGVVRSKPGALDLEAELALTGRGLALERLAPYTRPFGIEPALADATLDAWIVAGIRRTSEAWSARLALRDMALAEGGTPLVSVGELHIEEARLAESLALDALLVKRPFVRVESDDAGVLTLAGLRFVPVEREDPAPAPAPAPLALPALPPALVRALSVEDARVHWRSSALETELEVDFAAQELGTLGAPARFELEAKVAGAIESLACTGEVVLGAEQLALAARLEARGIRAGPLAELVPKGIELESEHGRLALELDAALRPAPDGGLAAGLGVRKLSWGEEGAEPWLALDAARLDVARLDPLAGVVELGPVRVAGTTVAARRDAGGRLHALGFVLGAEGAGQEEEPAASAGASAAANTPEETAAPAAVRPTRLVLTEELLLELARFRLVDEGLGPEARPLEGSVAFALETPCTILDAEPDRLRALAFSLEGTLAGLIERWRIEGAWTPFATEPRFEARLAASGVRTAGVIELAPSLAAISRGTVEDGTLAGRLAATFAVRRARPGELGLARPFGVALELDGLAYRDSPEGAVLAGIDRIAADVERVDLARGLVHARTLELFRPRGALRRSGPELHALGFALFASEAEAPEQRAAPPAETRGSRAPDGAPDAASPTELRIDEILVSGIDFELRDDTGEPALVVPLQELEAEVKRFTTRALIEERAIQFSAEIATRAAVPGAAVEAGARAPDDVAREAPRPLAPGVDAAQRAASAGGPHASSAVAQAPPVPVFDELQLAGRIALHPAPKGWAQISLDGLELPPFTGVTQPSGLVLEDGALDVGVRLRLLGERGAKVDTSLVFTDLDVQEPEGGVLEELLSLPMTLDAALALLKNQDGEHRFSVGVAVDESGVSTAQIARAATGAFAEVLARALAAAPLRLVGTIVPFGSGADTSVQAWRFAFLPGSTELDPGAAAFDEVRRLLDRNRTLVAVLRHELSNEDVARAELRANPSSERCLELVERLRRRKAELARSRDERAVEARTLHALGADEARAATESLRALERELAATERSLDEVLEILRSDSPRQRTKRTRATCREIAELRLASAERALTARMLDSDLDRIVIRSPRFEPLAGDGDGRVVIELRGR